MSVDVREIWSGASGLRLKLRTMYVVERKSGAFDGRRRPVKIIYVYVGASLGVVSSEDH